MDAACPLGSCQGNRGCICPPKDTRGSQFSHMASRPSSTSPTHVSTTTSPTHTGYSYRSPELQPLPQRPVHVVARAHEHAYGHGKDMGAGVSAHGASASVGTTRHRAHARTALHTPRSAAMQRPRESVPHTVVTAVHAKLKAASSAHNCNDISVSTASTICRDNGVPDSIIS